MLEWLGYVWWEGVVGEARICDGVGVRIYEGLCSVTKLFFSSRGHVPGTIILRWRRGSDPAQGRGVSWE